MQKAIHILLSQIQGVWAIYRLTAKQEEKGHHVTTLKQNIYQ